MQRWEGSWDLSKVQLQQLFFCELHCLPCTRQAGYMHGESRVGRQGSQPSPPSLHHRRASSRRRQPSLQHGPIPLMLLNSSRADYLFQDTKMSGKAVVYVNKEPEGQVSAPGRPSTRQPGLANRCRLDLSTHRRPLACLPYPPRRCWMC